MRSFEVVINQQLGRHASREVRVVVEACKSAGEAFRRIAARLTQSCEIIRVQEVR